MEWENQPTPAKLSDPVPQPNHGSSPSRLGGGAKTPPSSAASVGGANDFAARREIADKLEQEMHGTQIEWTSDTKGICVCPNSCTHAGSSPTECVLWIDGDFTRTGAEDWPTKHCSHNHCQDHFLIKKFNQELRARIGLAERREEGATPNDYLKRLYPHLSDQYGDPIHGEWSESRRSIRAKYIPKYLNERFFAALIIREGNHKNPALWDRDEGICLRYQPGIGIYEQVRVESLHETLDLMLLDAARNSLGSGVDTGVLETKMRSTRTLAPIITKASGLASISSDVWRWPQSRIPLRNGVLNLENNQLARHSPDNYFRGVVAVDYVPEATCPQWEALLGRQVNSDDADLLQRILGLILLADNRAQVMTLFYGAAGSGKGTIARLFIELIGQANTGTLRTSKLADRFEMGRHQHKLLLYGPDVNEDFLSNEGAALLKAITGEDPISPEFKNSNMTPAARPIRASVMVTANSRLRIRFQGDKEAWRRRLIPISFEKEVPEDERVPGLSQKLLDQEGPGILNWGLEGVRRLIADGGKIVLNSRQKGVRDALLDESESSVAFAREGIIKRPRGRLLASEAYAGYVQFCTKRGWAPETKQRFSTEFNRAVVDCHGITQATDLVTDGGNVRGWRGLSCNSTIKDLDEL